MRPKVFRKLLEIDVRCNVGSPRLEALGHVPSRGDQKLSMERIEDPQGRDHYEWMLVYVDDHISRDPHDFMELAKSMLEEQDDVLPTSQKMTSRPMPQNWNRNK